MVGGGKNLWTKKGFLSFLQSHFNLLAAHCTFDRFWHRSIFVSAFCFFFSAWHHQTNRQQFGSFLQGSHRVWKTWKFEWTFSSQGKDHFSQFMEKSGRKFQDKSGNPVPLISWFSIAWSVTSQFVFAWQVPWWKQKRKGNPQSSRHANIGESVVLWQNLFFPLWKSHLCEFFFLVWICVCVLFVMVCWNFKPCRFARNLRRWAWCWPNRIDQIAISSWSHH